MENESPTLTPPEAPAPTEETKPAPQEATAAPQPETATKVEGAEEGTEQTVAAWAEIPQDNAEDLFEIEEVKAIHQKGIQEAHDTAYQELQGHMQPYLQGQKQTLDGIKQASEAILTQLSRAAEDGGLDKRAVEDILRGNRQELAALNGIYQNTGFWESVQQQVQAFSTAAGDASLATPFLARVGRMASNVPDPTFAADFVKKLTSKVRQEGHDEGYKKGLKEGKGAQATKQQVQEAQGTGANLAPGTGGGGVSYRTKAEARTLHAQNKISNADMRAIKDDPTIPEM